MNENTDNHKEQKMEKRGLLRRMCWKAEGQQLPSRGVSAATWQPKWKYHGELQMERHHSEKRCKCFSLLHSQVAAPGIVLFVQGKRYQKIWNRLRAESKDVSNRKPIKTED